MDNQTNTASAEAFNRALAAYRATLDAFNFSPDDTPVEHERMLEAAWVAADKMVIATPAANLSDLRAKAELMFQEVHSTPPREFLLSFMQDLARLTNYEPSRTFCAKTWVRWFERCGGMWHIDGDRVTLLNTEAETFRDHMFTLTACNGREQVEAHILANRRNMAEAA